MQINQTNTKANLMLAKRNLEVCRKGYELLDKKRSVLVLNMMKYIDRAKQVEDELSRTFMEGYEALRVANITLGVASVAEIADSFPLAKEFSIETRSIMGVTLPSITPPAETLDAAYGFFDTNPALDIAVEKFQKIKEFLYKLSQIEDSVYKLKTQIEKTSKRANALINIQIPKYERLVKTISEVLEEKEREEFFRLKKCKQRA